MKSQIILLALIILINYTSIEAQEVIECAAVVPPGITVQQSQSGNLNLYKRTTITHPLRLAVHIIRYSNGSGGISQAELDLKINNLNSFMAQVLLSFMFIKQITLIMIILRTLIMT